MKKKRDEKVPRREGMGGLTRKCLRFRVMKKKRDEKVPRRDGMGGL